MPFVCRYDGSVWFPKATSKNVGGKYAAMTEGFGETIYMYVRWEVQPLNACVAFLETPEPGP